MAFYIKVTKEVADRLHLTDIRNRTADGNVLLWQADVARFPATRYLTGPRKRAASA
ncbi:hypothetical protein QNN11_11570 [Phocaeicola dorei]|uniref:Uncharacterized protein n=1 Tax=Phocaeicola dorei TaxID=357276 RepID=A0AA95HY75_9BACT|nr:hypothetical protein QNN11_21700 [Phocaeicola dorei]WHX11792.1 hypothetical protein QNN11_11570 [Phocaeicola dorei]